MRILLKISLAIIILEIAAFAQEPNVVWTKTYGTTGSEQLLSMCQTTDGGFIMAGYSGYGFYTMVYLVKVDILGNIEWIAQPNHIECQARCVELAVDNGYVVVGERVNAFRAFFMKFSPAGILERYVEYPYAGGKLNYIQRTGDGNYFVVGSYFDSIEHDEAWAAKLDAFGGIIWSHMVDFPGPYYSDYGLAGCESHCDPEPGYVITGKTSSVGDDYDIFIEKITPDGDHMWLTWFGSDQEDEGTAIKEVSDGYVVTGLYTTRAVLVKRAFNGTPVWEQYITDPAVHWAEGYDLETLVDGGFIICGAIRTTVEPVVDVLIVKTDGGGNIQWSKIIGGTEDDFGYSIEKIGIGTYIVAGKTSSFGAGLDDGYLIKLGPMLNDTDDSLSLAYNGNRHLIRAPNSEKLHLVYTRENEVNYQYSSDGGANWTSPIDIGTGKFPAITLNSGNLPSLTWTDDAGGLWYRRQTAANTWSEIYHLYDPWSYWQARLNSPPSIVSSPCVGGDSVHILGTMHVVANGPINLVAEFKFRIDLPLSGSFLEIEGGAGVDAGAIRYDPSIARSDLNNSLHAVWQRADTICYATRQIAQSWNNWGWQFQQWGLQSAQPFVESYGDMVYVVWQHQETPTEPEEIYKAKRQIGYDFTWEPFSLTPTTKSLYPVNASGMFTVWADGEQYVPPDSWFEIYYKVYPADDLTNISNTAGIKSLYPHSAARFLSTRTYLFTAWLEGDVPPYEIRFKKLQYYIPPAEFPVYLTSLNGYETPSPYLVQRDSYIAGWQIPVDAGYETITYQFPLKPRYRYKIKAVAYHQSSGEWREWLIINNKQKHLLKYEAYLPETLEFWVAPAFYEDGLLDIAFTRMAGDFATAGPIEIQRYEYEETEGEGSGPMAQERYPASPSAVMLSPNPFAHTLKIALQTQKETKFSIKVYDISGRLVKNLYEGIIAGNHLLNWNSADENSRTVSHGIYFVRIENLDSGETLCKKVLKIE